MSRKNIIFGVLALVVLLGAGFYFFGSPFNRQLPYTVIETGDRQYKESGDYYTIQLNYPDKTPLLTRSGSGAENKAQATINKTLSQLIDQFKQAGSINSLSQEEKDRLNQSGLKYSLNVGYRAYSAGNYVSYEFDVFMDTGGAHPNNFFKTLVFDLNGNAVSLGDLFTSNDYLNRIAGDASVQVKDQLTRRIGDDPGDSFIDAGTAPDIKNFENFVIDSDRLRIFIPPYQAAAYAAGSFEVQVPFSELKDILKPNVK